MDTILTKICAFLTPWLDKLGTGWKTVVGLLLAAAVVAAHSLQHNGQPILPDPYYGYAWDAACALFGIGIVHKVGAATLAAKGA